MVDTGLLYDDNDTSGPIVIIIAVSSSLLLNDIFSM